MNIQQQSEQQPGEKKGREKSLCSEFELRRNSKNITEPQIKIVPKCSILRTTGNCVEIEIWVFSVVFRINSFIVMSIIKIVQKVGFIREAFR